MVYIAMMNEYLKNVNTIIPENKKSLTVLSLARRLTISTYGNRLLLTLFIMGSIG